MKKAILYLWLFAATIIQVRSQNPTTYRTYTLATSGIDNMESTVYGNRLYNVASGGAGILVEKNDLNGTPVLAKIIPVQANSDVKFNVFNGNLYLNATVSGSVAYVPCLIKLDTVNFNLVFYKNLDFNSGGNTFISSSKVMSNGQLILCGYNVFSGSQCRGFITQIDMASGNIVTTQTINLPGPPFNFYVHDVTETSNSTLQFSAFSTNGNSYIGKAIKSASSISITSLYSTNASFQKLDRIPGSSKMLSADSYNVVKLDTNFALLSGASIKQFTNTASYSRPFFAQNKLYMVGRDTSMVVIDSLLNIVSDNSYPTTQSTFTNVNVGSISYRTSFCRSANQLYIIYRPPIYYDKFSMLKTTLSGNIGCSHSSPFEIMSTITVTSGVVASINQGSITVGTYPASITPTPVTETVTFTDECFSTTADIINNEIGEKTLHVQYLNEGCLLNSVKDLSALEILDISGKKVKTMKFNIGDNQTFVDLSGFSKGVFIMQIQFQDLSYERLKLLNY
jgi:hypothetical protein